VKVAGAAKVMGACRLVAFVLTVTRDSQIHHCISWSSVHRPTGSHTSRYDYAFDAYICELCVHV
jgi:hypothetical protein